MADTDGRYCALDALSNARFVRISEDVKLVMKVRFGVDQLPESDEHKAALSA